MHLCHEGKANDNLLAFLIQRNLLTKNTFLSPFFQIEYRL